MGYGTDVKHAMPPFMTLVAHPVRWRILQELGHSDRMVAELTDLVDEPQNLVSYHLRKLRDGGLVTGRRSSADGRDVYYALDLPACREQLRTTGGSLHPGLALVEVPSPRTVPRVRRPRVLFLCTGNSARSQMAAGILEHRSDGSVEATSAGSHPKPLHPLAVRTMRRRGVDIAGNPSTHVDEVAGRRFDVVVTLCDRVREVCPELAADPQLVHWSIADPSVDGSVAAFEATADELDTRIAFLLHQLSMPPKRRPAHAHR